MIARYGNGLSGEGFESAPNKAPDLQTEYVKADMVEPPTELAPSTGVPPGKPVPTPT
jgi:hypothetical protein